jgi:hypothetical protein
VNDHDIIGSTRDDVECRCGWVGPRDGHALHWLEPDAVAAIASAREALKKGNT